MMSLLLLVFTTMGFAPNMIEMSISPRFNYAPAFQVITIHIVRSPNNRGIEWVCDSPTGDYRASEIELDGSNSPAQFRTEWRRVGAGVYTCLAKLRGADNSILGRAVTGFEVRGR